MESESAGMTSQPLSADDGGLADIETTALESLTRGEVDVQIRTAKAYPRDIRRCRQHAEELACLDQETAEACIYALPRSGKKIDGPSVRLAEILAHSWGNLRVAKRILSVDAKTVTAQAVCHDMERNVAISAEVRRRIVSKGGTRYNDDMITMTANAAASIALRNSVLAVIPQALWKGIYRAARETAIGTSETLVDRRAKLLAYFAKMGIFEERLLAAVEKKSVDEIGLDDLAWLRGAANKLRDGEADIDDVFPDPATKKPEGATKPRTKRAADAVKAATPEAAEQVEALKAHDAKAADQDFAEVEAPPEPPAEKRASQKAVTTASALFMALKKDEAATIRTNFGLADKSLNVQIGKWSEAQVSELKTAIEDLISARKA